MPCWSRNWTIWARARPGVAVQNLRLMLGLDTHVAAAGIGPCVSWGT